MKRRAGLPRLGAWVEIGKNEEDETMAQETPPQIVPNLFVDAVEPLRDFYLEKLGFGHFMGLVGKDGKLDFAIVQRDGVMVMIGRPQEKLQGTAPQTSGRPVEIYIYVKDVDAYHAEVAKKGLKPVNGLATQWWGDRNFSVRDPYGYLLWFCQTVEDFKPQEGMKVI
jgi:uncharacterized glyoxalase superfamily protein PhnB